MKTSTYVSNMVTSLRETSFNPYLSKDWTPVQGHCKLFPPKHSKASSLKTPLSANDVRSTARKIYVGVAPQSSNSLPKSFYHKPFTAKTFSTDCPKRFLKNFSKSSKPKTTTSSFSDDVDFDTLMNEIEICTRTSTLLNLLWLLLDLLFFMFFLNCVNQHVFSRNFITPF